MHDFAAEHHTAWRGRPFGRGGVFRPPWTNESRIRQNCTSCGDCIAACPEAILVAGPAHTPTVDFATGACTFCGDCAAACSEDVFADTTAVPWELAAVIEQHCLLSDGVSCRTCTDACDEDALRFDLRGGSVGAVRVQTDACTGCGACVGMCPVGAITLRQDRSPKLAAAE